VTYRQTLGRWERSYGYFRSSRFADFFRYEVWPISRWQHAPGFHIDGSVEIHRPRPSWLRRTFSKVRSVGCRGLGPGAYSALEQRGDVLRLAFRLADPLPKRLWCFVGDEDLVP
jgi:hypothetical protein